MKALIRLLPLLACLLVACHSPSSSSHIPDIASQTPEDDEVAVSCPPLLGKTPPGTIAALLPPDPFSGQLNGCGLSPNSEDGAPFSGFFADEAELDRLGRLCGCDALGDGKGVWTDYFSVRGDVYLTTTGARAAFKMESQTLTRGFEDVSEVDEARLASLGEERVIMQHVFYVNGQQTEGQRVLLVRWHNIVARIELSPYHPTEMLLDYAAQLDKNIQAAAQ